VSEKNWEFVSCTDCTDQGTDFELILTVKIATRNPVEGYFGSEYPAICNHCGVMAGRLDVVHLRWLLLSC